MRLIFFSEHNNKHSDQIGDLKFASFDRSTHLILRREAAAAEEEEKAPGEADDVTAEEEDCRPSPDS